MHHFLAKTAIETGLALKTVTDDALKLLHSYRPGNIKTSHGRQPQVKLESCPAKSTTQSLFLLLADSLAASQFFPFNCPGSCGVPRSPSGLPSRA